MVLRKVHSKTHTHAKLLSLMMKRFGTNLKEKIIEQKKISGKVNSLTKNFGNRQLREKNNSKKELGMNSMNFSISNNLKTLVLLEMTRRGQI